jgi:hypothetical protein
MRQILTIVFIAMFVAIAVAGIMREPAESAPMTSSRVESKADAQPLAAIAGGYQPVRSTSLRRLVRVQTAMRSRSSMHTRRAVFSQRQVAARVIPWVRPV